MQPDIAQAIAQAHIDDLHREAARHRRAGLAVRARRLAGAAFPEQWSTLRTAAGRVALPVVRREPGCCPA